MTYAELTPAHQEFVRRIATENGLSNEEAYAAILRGEIRPER